MDRKGMESYVLYEGDQILCGVTHQIQIGRENSWVKYEATTKVRPDETAEGARARAVGHVNESAMYAVEAAVEAVRKAGH